MSPIFTALAIPTMRSKQVCLISSTIHAFQASLFDLEHYPQLFRMIKPIFILETE
jgi:hypothetical protein